MNMRSIKGISILGHIVVLALISSFWVQIAELLTRLQPANGWPSGIRYMYRLYIRLIVRRENPHIPRIPVDIAVASVSSTGCTVQYILTMGLIAMVSLDSIVSRSNT